MFTCEVFGDGSLSYKKRFQKTHKCTNKDWSLLRAFVFDFYIINSY